MKTIYVLTIAVLLGLTYGLTSDQEFFQRLSYGEFGKTIIESLQLEMNQEGGNSVDRILNLLRQMQSDLKEEQQSEASSNTQRQSVFQQRIEEANGVITVANERKASDERLLPLKEEELRDKQKQSQDKNTEERRNLDEIQALTDSRKQTRAEYEERREELTSLVGALKEAKTIISQLKNKGFLQMNESILTQIKDHQKKFQQNYPKQRGFFSLINVMLTTIQDKTLHADQGIVDKLLNIINDLIESVYDVQKQEMRADDQRQQDYVLQRTRVENANKRLATSVAQLNADVQTIIQNILEISNDVAAQQAAVDGKSTERDDWKKTGNDAQNSFNRMTDNRKEQLDIINKCINIFETNAIPATSFVQQIHIH